MHVIFPLKIAPTTDIKDLETALSDIMSNTVDMRGYRYEVRVSGLKYGPSHERYILDKAKSWNDDMKAHVMSTAPLLNKKGMPQDVIEDLYNSMHDLKDQWSCKSRAAIVYDALLVCRELDFGFYDVRTVMLDEILRDITANPGNYACAEMDVRPDYA